MAKRYCAFDIETAKILSEDDFNNWKAHRPLGICCASALACDAKEAVTWHGKKAAGGPAPRMSRPECGDVVHALRRLVREGYTLLTWNGLRFDLDVLSEESGCFQECKEMAWGHVDMMYHVFCEKGFPVKLEKAAQALGVPGKLAGMSGRLAPQLWLDGRYKDVLDYVGQDVRSALEIAIESERRGRFEWMTQKGTRGSMNLGGGWLTVREALNLPLPDNSWMKNPPIHRSEFTGWLGLS